MEISHLATVVVVLLAHALIIHMFSRVGSGAAPRDEPHMVASLVDGAGFASASRPTVRPSSATPALAPTAVATEPEAAAPAAVEAPVVDPVNPLGEVSYTARPIELGPVAAASPAAQLTAPAGGVICQVVEDIQASISADALSQRAIGLIPASSRSVANAVKVWDAGWSPAVDLTTGPLQAVGRSVASVMDKTSPACLDEVLHGPRLVLVVDDRGAPTLLAFGSGDWQWKAVQNDLRRPHRDGLLARLLAAF